MSDDVEPDTLEERVAYWRDQAKDARTSLSDAQDALAELEEMSRGLEAELEAELAAAQRARDVAVRAAETARAEATSWKERYTAASSESSAELAAVRRELTRTADEYAAHRDRLRDMEVNNDELEAAERAIAASLSDMEAKYNRSLEQTVLLQEEIAAKDALLEENQRLKDYISELTEELAVRRVRPATPESTPAETVPAVSPVEDGESSPGPDPVAASGACQQRIHASSFTSGSTSSSAPLAEFPSRPSGPGGVRSSTPLMTPTRMAHASVGRTTPLTPSMSALPRPVRSVHTSLTQGRAKRTTVRTAAARPGAASELTARINALKQHLNRAQRPVQDRRGRVSGIPRPVSRMSASGGTVSPSTSFSSVTPGPSPIPPPVSASASGIPKPRASVDRSALPRLSSSALRRSPSAAAFGGGPPAGRVRTRPASQLSFHGSSDAGTGTGPSSPPRPPSRSLYSSSRPWSPSVGGITRPFSPAGPGPGAGGPRPFSPTKSALPRLSTGHGHHGHSRRHSQALANLGTLNSALPTPSPADKLAARVAVDRARSPGQRP